MWQVTVWSMSVSSSMWWNLHVCKFPCRLTFVSCLRIECIQSQEPNGLLLDPGIKDSDRAQQYHTLSMTWESYSAPHQEMDKHDFQAEKSPPRLWSCTRSHALSGELMWNVLYLFCSSEKWSGTSRKTAAKQKTRATQKKKRKANYRTASNSKSSQPPGNICLLLSTRNFKYDFQIWTAGLIAVIAKTLKTIDWFQLRNIT